MDKESLIEAAPLLQGELLNRRKELKTELIRYALSTDRCPEEFTSNDLITFIRSKFGINMDSGVVTACLQELEAKGVVKHMQANEYNLKKSPEANTFDDLVNPVWKEFSNELQKEREEIDIYSINKGMEPAFRDFLLEFFLDIANSFESLSEYEVDTLYTDNTENLIEEIIESHDLRDENTFRTVLIEYIQNPRKNDELLDFTDKIYRGVVNVDLLTKERDSEFPRISDIPKENRKIFLDTNAIVNLLCETDKLHPLAAKVCEKSLDNGFELFYFSETKIELEGLIGGAEHEMDGIYNGNRSFEAAETQFVKDFRRKEDISWEKYIEEIRNWEETLQRWNIEEFTQDIEPNEKVMSEAKELLVEYEDQLTQQSLDRLNHDASLYGYAAQIRVRASGSFGPFILSFHNNFTSSGYEIAQKEGLRGIIGDHVLAMQARKWLNYLLSFSSIDFDEADRKEVSLAILQGATNFEDSMSIRDYSRLLVPKLDLEAEDEDYLAEYLRGHPLHEELQEALDNNQGNKAERVSRKIITDTEHREAIQEERQFHERIQKASSRVEELEQENEEKEEKIKELEQRVKSLENSSGDTVIVQESTSISKSSSSSDSKSHAEVELGFDQKYSEFITEFNQQLRNGEMNLEDEIPDQFNASNIQNPPGSESDLDKKKEWLQTLSAMITVTGTTPKFMEHLKPELNDLLSLVLGIS